MRSRRDAHSLASRVIPTFGLLIFAVGFIRGLVGLRLLRGDGDVGRHIRVGQDILATGRIPAVDTYSHTMRGAPFVPYEWLSEVLVGKADALSGLAGVAVLSALVFGATSWVAYRIARLVGSGPLFAILAAGLGLVLQTTHLLPRPHLFTTLFAALFLWLLEAVRLGHARQLLLALPVLMLVWANLHGGFLVGFVLLAVYLADAWLPGSTARSHRGVLAGVTAACLLASLLTPAGPGLWAHTTGYLGVDFLVDRTIEYQSPDFHATYGRALLLVILMGIGLLATGSSRVSFVETAMFAGWLAAALHSGRNIPLFAVLAVPFYAAWARRVCSDPARLGPLSTAAGRLLTVDTELERTERVLRPALLSAAVTLGVLVFALGPLRAGFRFDPSFFPVEALSRVPAGGLRGNVLNDMAWGGYLLLERPDIPVFMDGQTDFYGADLGREYVGAMAGLPDWKQVLEKYGIGWTLTGTDAALVQLLRCEDGWIEVYRDDVAVIMSSDPSSRRVGPP